MSDDESTSGYKVAPKVDMRTVLEMDKDDESLAKYKAALLGSQSEDISPADDPRRVVIKELRVVFESRPKGDIVYTLDNDEAVRQMKDNPFILKEGCKYKLRVTFKVQHEIVSGLKYHNAVYRKGVRVAKDEEMLGSFAPQSKFHEVTFPRHGWEETPSGMLARGSYTAISKFVDDDKQQHLQYEYAFSIKKDWD